MARSPTARSSPTSWEVPPAAIGVTVEGGKDVLGLWAGTPGQGEGAKFWLAVLTEIKNRGAADTMFVVCDGLKGLPDSVAAVWPEAIVQTSSMHHGGGGIVSPGCLHRRGQDRCKRVTFEVHMQTRPSAAGQAQHNWPAGAAPFECRDEVPKAELATLDGVRRPRAAKREQHGHHHQRRPRTGRVRRD